MHETKFVDSAGKVESGVTNERSEVISEHNEVTAERHQILHDASGQHLLLTLRECSAEFLNDELKLRELTLAAAQATGATVLQITSHRFAPQGVTALAVLAESHASLHTYPEANLVFWDCFTCGTTCNPELSVPVLAEALNAKVVSKQVVARD